MASDHDEGWCCRTTGRFSSCAVLVVGSDFEAEMNALLHRWALTSTSAGIGHF
ncbi:hypothetical protein OG884_11935 [Streptosporangium sp. NBC_01755]|uniref:hypothetical protein n=1 Tax=unclassified Streptosporangium TaxID=2632669 RepID=UPI002DD93DCA|nr:MULTISPECIES: hypothetical protein [unclassified Streptosporangium]WSA26005.1 hypothetical protein OIE13_34775 [Streptosporangium sp. NBC_01810]WSD02573.1 hypothetical protein OG884_11935 [Streptosporangium sp. NBC_01755]